jgi:rare lipoprotein A
MDALVVGIDSDRVEPSVKASPMAIPRARRRKVIVTGATWYGPYFHGRLTASGERFNRNAMTLASRQLPLGTWVRVTNPANGRSAVARVNDRGPYGRPGYTCDLSQALARQIGIGKGRVHLEVLRDPAPVRRASRD